MDDLYANFSQETYETALPYDLSSVIDQTESKKPFQEVLQILLRSGAHNRNSTHEQYSPTPYELIR